MTHDELDALLLAAEENNKRGDFANAEKLAREVIQLVEETNPSSSNALFIRALLALSESLASRGLIKDALLIDLEALDRSKAGIGTEILHAKALLRIGLGYRGLSEFAKALDYLEKGLTLFEKLGHSGGIATTIGNIGILYNHLGQHLKAIECYEKALELDEGLGRKASVAVWNNNIASVYIKNGQFAKALEYLDKALALGQELGKRSGMADPIGNIGLVYCNLGDYPKALEYYEKALELDEEAGNISGVALWSGNIGHLYLQLSQNTRALDYFQKALRLSEEIGAKRQVAVWLGHVGSTLSEMGENQRAMEFLQRALHVNREEIGSNEFVAANLLEIGSLLAKSNQFDKAIEKLEEAAVLAEKFEEQIELSGAHEELENIYAKQGDTAKAYEHLTKRVALDKEIFNDDTRKRVEAFNFRVATANKERDLKLARLEKEQAEAALRLKERDLVNTASSLAAQTELLGNFRADLRKIVLRPDRYEPEDIIRQVKAKLKELPCEMIDFSKFEGQFATVHPEFRARLETTYPGLTPQEVKMCMLIHVNLQSAAIARLMCLSERSVEGHRLNIRKKLALAKEQSIAEVLRKLDGTQPTPSQSSRPSQ